MELRQLACFVAAADFGSTRRAAEHLHTSQSSVSKHISMLEQELSVILFRRSNRGLRLSEEGRELYDYAHGMLQNARLMQELGKRRHLRRISIACYPSTMISRLFCRLYEECGGENLRMSFLEGTVEEIVDYVHEGMADMGIVYFSKDQQGCFEHILSHRDCEYTELSQHAPCIYVGPRSPLYEREKVSFADLEGLNFIQPLHDFFSIEHHLDRISVGMARTSHFESRVSTNSDNQIIEMLLHTDVCSFGIRLMNDDYRKYAIRDVPIEDCGRCLSFGFIRKRKYDLAEEYRRFIALVDEHLCKVQRDRDGQALANRRSITKKKHIQGVS
ncbi:LysR family transcriptional regulator [Desulfovibrio piger]|nr:LysR family transcriptional regulator [Desulfovibrio piger]